MATRHAARAWAMQVLFSLDFNPLTPDQALALFWQHRKADERSQRFTGDLVRGVVAHRDELDELIRQHAANWGLQRINAVDRSILRIALFEMRYRPDIPPIVSINEAVDLAKRFSGGESGKFVNGILDQARLSMDVTT
ncbi:MAG: transcription antitermination factor NusB [Kiritimatiellia bacterium]|jgi:N utilization substance protein B